MSDDKRPLFTSFDDAWRWFVDDGALTSMEAWRERLTAGRGQLLSFQMPLDETSIADAVEELQDELADVAGLAMFEREMLHISLRGVGFQVIAKKRPDDVSREDIGRITQRAAKLLRGANPVAVEAGPVNVFPDALILEVHDGGALGLLRQRLAEDVDDAFGIEDGQYLPHITIAMFRDPAIASALRGRLPKLRERAPAAATLNRAELARWWFTGAAEFPERDPVRAYPLR
jgi:2'-5' RNA ligase